VTPDELPVALGALRDRLLAYGARDAATRMALAAQREIVKSMRGDPVPSAPGTPPARRTGTLARSLRVVPALGGFARAVARLAPHTVYARIQQLGGHIYPVRARVLRWKGLDGKAHFAKHVYLPPRPYMQVIRETAVKCRAAAIDAVQAVIRGG
jgi:hypothetical protein